MNWDWLPDLIDNGSNIGALLAIPIAILAAVLSIVSLRYTKEQRDASNRQAVAAETSAAAATASAVAAEAQVEVMKRQVALMEQEGRAGTAVAEAPYVPPWTVRHVKGDTFSLVNGGSSTEYDVEIVLPPHSISRGADEPIEKIGPRSSHSFIFAATSATPRRIIRVTWAREPGGERLTWEDAIPDKTK